METTLTGSLIFAAIAFGGSVVLVVIESLLAQPGRLGTIPSLLLIAAALGVGGTPLWSHPVAAALAVADIGLLLALAVRKAGISSSGAMLIFSNAQLVLLGLAWSLWFIATIDVSKITRALMLAGYPLLGLTILTSVFQAIEQWEALVRVTWRRPRTALEPFAGHRSPFVSIHVPAYAEPPDVVIRTLDSISRLDYANYEVIVVDNNTRDESLWLPVEAYCERLGPRFGSFTWIRFRAQRPAPSISH